MEDLQTKKNIYFKYALFFTCVRFVTMYMYCNVFNMDTCIVVSSLFSGQQLMGSTLFEPGTRLYRFILLYLNILNV